MRFVILLTAMAAFWFQPALAATTVHELKLSGSATGSQRITACNGSNAPCATVLPFSTALDLTLFFDAAVFQDGVEAFSFGQYRTAQGAWSGTINYLGDGLFSGSNLRFTRVSPSITSCGRTCYATEEAASAAAFSVIDMGAPAFARTAVTPPAVPEPSTWALMLLGFGGVGAAMRRRRLGALALA